MSITIKTEKVIDAKLGISRKILEICALREEELPKEYFGSDYCYLTENRTDAYLHISSAENGSLRLVLLAAYTEPEFQKRMEIIRRCANRLHEIKEKFRQAVKNGWAGEETFVI